MPYISRPKSGISVVQEFILLQNPEMFTRMFNIF